ncbi:MAG: nucleotidyltransferase family protein [Ignavibacteriae bacterium]|nr:nucleotidyltransferase family protein [Ignavibacteriota bacterium]
MSTINRIKESIKKKRKDIHRNFKVKEIGIFGSFVKVRNSRTSDIDILVEFEKGCTTFDNYMDLKFFLEKMLRRKVDVVLKNTLRPELREKILSETIYV